MKKLEIFLIEDSLGDVLMIQEALNLRKIDADLKVANDGEKAVRELAAMDPARLPRLMIIDLNLPRMNGMQVLDEVRKSAKFAHTPVVVFSSSLAAADRAEAEKRGADAFVTKPLTLDEFVAAIGDAIERVLRDSRQGCNVNCQARRANPSRSGRRDARRRLEARPVGLTRAGSQDGF